MIFLFICSIVFGVFRFRCISFPVYFEKLLVTQCNQIIDLSLYQFNLMRL